MLTTMKNERCLNFGKKRIAGGAEVSEPREVPTFVIEYLPELTKEQFDRIALKQAAQGTLES